MAPSTQASRSNIDIIFSDWLDAMRRGDLDRMGSILIPDAVHRGVKPDWVCQNREEIIDNVRRQGGRVPQINAFELLAAGDHVVLSVQGPELGAPVDEEGRAFPGQACVVFTLRDGMIVRMQDYSCRSDALEAAGAAVAWQ